MSRIAKLSMFSILKISGASRPIVSAVLDKSNFEIAVDDPALHVRNFIGLALRKLVPILSNLGEIPEDRL